MLSIEVMKEFEDKWLDKVRSGLREEGYIVKDHMVDSIVKDFLATLSSSLAINDEFIRKNDKHLGDFLVKYLQKPRIIEWLYRPTASRTDKEYKTLIERTFTEQLKQENKNAERFNRENLAMSAEDGLSRTREMRDAKEIKARGEARKNEAAGKIQALYRGHATKAKVDIAAEGAYVLNGIFYPQLAESQIHIFEHANGTEVTQIMLEMAFLEAASRGNTQLMYLIIPAMQDRGFLSEDKLLRLMDGAIGIAERSGHEATKKELNDLKEERLYGDFTTKSKLEIVVDKCRKNVEAERERTRLTPEQRREALKEIFISTVGLGLPEHLDFLLKEIASITPQEQQQLLADSFLRAARTNNFAAVEKLMSLAEPNQALIEAMKAYIDDITIYADVSDMPRGNIEGLLRELNTALGSFHDASGTSLSAVASPPAVTASTVSAAHSSVDVSVSSVGSPASVADIERASPPSLGGAAAVVSDHFSAPAPLASSVADTASVRDEGVRAPTALSTVAAGGAGAGAGAGSSISIDSRAVLPEVLGPGAAGGKSLVDSLKDEFVRTAIEGKDSLLPTIIRSLDIELSKDKEKKSELERLYIDAFMGIVNQGKNNKALSKLESMLIEIGHKSSSPVIKAIKEYKENISSILSSPREDVRKSSLARLKANVHAKIATAPVIADLKPVMRGGAAGLSSIPVTKAAHRRA